MQWGAMILNGGGGGGVPGGNNFNLGGQMLKAK